MTTKFANKSQRNGPSAEFTATPTVEPANQGGGLLSVMSVMTTTTPTPEFTPTATPEPTITATAAPTQTPTPTPEPGAPALPPLEVIVMNRLAYGARPGDLQAFRNLPGATPADKLNAWLDIQLNPAGINDADCTNRVAAHALPTMIFNDSAATIEGAGGSNTQPVPAGPMRVFLPVANKAGLPNNENAVLKALWHTYYRGRYRSTNPSTYWGQYPEDRPADDVMIATILRATYSKRQLYEVMVEYWHNHFNVYAYDGYARWTWQHYDAYVIRKYALGNFRKLLGAVAKSPAMLYYLDNYINTQAGPNENWARELFELHGLGAEHYAGAVPGSSVPRLPTGEPEKYVDQDVYSAADCFTGWGVDDRWGNDNDPNSWGTGRFQYTAEDHDNNSVKIVLGRTIQAFGPPMSDGETVLDMIANHPNAAKYIAGRMCRRLIGDDVDAATVQSVADVFYANREASDQIAKTVRAIATSAAFANTFAAKVKRPYEHMIAALRTTGIELNVKPVLKTGTDATGKVNAWWEDPIFRWDGLVNNYESCGMPIFQKRSPDGWSDRRITWTGTTGMLFRWKLMYFLVNAGTAADRTDIRVDFVAQTVRDVPTRTSANIVDYWIGRVIGYPINPESRQSMIDYLGKGNTGVIDVQNSNEVKRRLSLLVSLILSSPEFTWR